MVGSEGLCGVWSVGLCQCHISQDCVGWGQRGLCGVRENYGVGSEGLCGVGSEGLCGWDQMDCVG